MPTLLRRVGHALSTHVSICNARACVCGAWRENAANAAADFDKSLLQTRELFSRDRYHYTLFQIRASTRFSSFSFFLFRGFRSFTLRRLADENSAPRASSRSSSFALKSSLKNFLSRRDLTQFFTSTVITNSTTTDPIDNGDEDNHVRAGRCRQFCRL